jgi:hypothetical protein
MTGCTNIKAVNFNPSATEDDRSCIFLLPNGNDCNMFADVTESELEDISFTVSWSLITNTWVFFHTYKPNIYFHTRKNLWSIDKQIISKHNEGLPGNYYDKTIEPFFVDVVFNEDSDTILESLEWISEVLNNSKEEEFQTFTHISIWNSQQHSGKIPVSTIFNNLQYDTSRRTRGVWSFNDFRDIVETRGSQFIDTLFKDYAILPNTLNPNKPWYEKELMQDKYHIVRFEFDNTSTNTILVHNVNANTLKADR